MNTYKMLIVDDEKIIREGIKKSIQEQQKEKSDQYIIEIEEASNGIEALEYILNNPIQILFLDIHMPFMNGLELARIVKKEFPEIRIIMITGFHTIEYTREALKCGVDDYILKPVDVASIQSVVIAQIKNIQSSEVLEYKKTNLEITETFLRELVFGTAEGTQENIEELSERLSIGQEMPVHLILFAPCGLELEFVDRQKHVLMLAVTNIVNRILSVSKMGIGFSSHKHAVYGMLVYKLEEPEELEELMQEIKTEIYDAFNLDMQFYVSPEAKLQELDRLVMCVKEIQKTSYLEPEKEFLYYKSQNIKKDEVAYPQELEYEFMYYLGLYQKEKMVEVLSRLERYILDRKLPLYNSKMIILRFMTSINCRFQYIKERYYKIENHHYIDSFQILNCETKEEALGILNESIKIELEINFKDVVCNLNNYDKIYKYLEENYMDVNLNMNRCSEELYLSNSYIGQIVKNKTKFSFTKLLTTIRIEKSKECMGQGMTNLGEIAERVGFAYQTYFSTVFKNKKELLRESIWHR